MDKESLFLTMGLMGLFCGAFLFGAIVTQKEADKNMLKLKTEAVIKNFAHWEVSPEGKTTFNWNK